MQHSQRTSQWPRLGPRIEWGRTVIGCYCGTDCPYLIDAQTGPAATDTTSMSISITTVIDCCLKSVMPRVSVQDRAIIIGRLQSGYSARAVAQDFNVAHSTVSRLWRKFVATGSVADLPRAPKHRVTPGREDRHLVNRAVMQQNLTGTKILTFTRPKNNEYVVFPVHNIIKTIRNGLRANFKTCYCSVLRLLRLVLVLS